MGRRRMERVVRNMARHGKILLRGLIRTVYSALVAGLAGMAVMAFMAVPGERGYAAVMDFAAAVATMTVAVMCIYCSGGRGHRKERK